MLRKRAALDSLDDSALLQLIPWLDSPDILVLYFCGQKSLNDRLTRRLVTDLAVYVKKSDGKLPSVVRLFECLTTLSISFGDYYADLYKIEQLDLSLLPTSLIRLALCCSNANDFFEETENFIRSHEICHEHGIPTQQHAPVKSSLPNLKHLLLSTRSTAHSVAKRVPHKFLPDTNLVSVYLSFSIIGEHLTKFKTSHWEQAFLGLLPDTLEDFELETGLIIKSFTAFNVMPKSLTSLKGLVVMDHSMGWEVEFDAIFETVQQRSSDRFVSKLQHLEATTEVFYRVRSFSTCLFSILSSEFLTEILC